MEKRKKVNFDMSPNYFKNNVRESVKFFTIYDKIENKTAYYKESVANRVLLFENDENYQKLMDLIKVKGIENILTLITNENDSLTEDDIERMVMKILLKNKGVEPASIRETIIEEKKEIIEEKQKLPKSLFGNI